MIKHFCFPKNPVVHVATIAILTFIVYFNTLANGFVWDDGYTIVNNRLLDNINDIPRLFLAEDAFEGMKSGCYRPFTYVTFALDRALWGLDPAGFHLISLMLHISVAIAFYLLINRLFKDNLLAFSAALLFAIHPVNSETVNFLSGGRNTLLSALFILLSFIFYIDHRPIASIACFGISMFSKEFAILFPAMLVFHDRAMLKERKGPGNYLPFLAVIALYLLARGLVINGAGPLEIHELANRLMLVPELALRHLRIVVLPLGLKVPYAIRLPQGFDLRVAGPLAGSLFLVFAVYRFRTHKTVLFSAFWFLLFFLPISNVIPLGYILMSERNAYFLSMAFALLLASLIRDMKADFLKFPMMTAICIFFAVAVVMRNPVWKDELTLHSAMAVDSPESSIGNYGLGMHYYQHGELKKAAGYLEKAAAGTPPVADVFMNLGLLRWEMNEPEKAIQTVRDGLTQMPDNGMLLFFLGRLAENSGNAEQAGEYMKLAARVNPRAAARFRDKALEYALAGEKLHAAGRAADAERVYKRALLYDPRLARGLLGLGGIHADQGALEKAIECFRQAAAAEQANPLPHANLALAYELQGKQSEAAKEKAIYLRLERAGK